MVTVRTEANQVWDGIRSAENRRLLPRVAYQTLVRASTPRVLRSGFLALTTLFAQPNSVTALVTPPADAVLHLVTGAGTSARLTDHLSFAEPINAMSAELSSQVMFYVSQPPGHERHTAQNDAHRLRPEKNATG